MSASKPWPDKTIWDVEVTDKGQFAPQFAAFERHKETLIDILRDVHDDALTTAVSFDEDRTWNALSCTASFVFRRPQTRRKALLPRRRVERLRDLAKALNQARNLVLKAAQDDVGLELFRGWCAESEIPPAPGLILNSDGNVTFPFGDEIKELSASLATLTAAASRAAEGVLTKPGPLQGMGILPMEDLTALAAVYLASTGQTPSLGTGPFARFVDEFLVAVDRGGDTQEDYVVEAFKYARKQIMREKRRI